MAGNGFAVRFNIAIVANPAACGKRLAVKLPTDITWRVNTSPGRSDGARVAAARKPRRAVVRANHFFNMEK